MTALNTNSGPQGGYTVPTSTATEEDKGMMDWLTKPYKPQRIGAVWAVVGPGGKVAQHGLGSQQEAETAANDWNSGKRKAIKTVTRYKAQHKLPSISDIHWREDGDGNLEITPKSRFFYGEVTRDDDGEWQYDVGLMDEIGDIYFSAAQDGFYTAEQAKLAGSDSLKRQIQNRAHTEKGKAMKTVTRYLVKTAKGYVTKDDNTYTDDDDEAQQFDDPAEAQGKADKEDEGKPEDAASSEVEEVETEVPDEDTDKPKDGEEPFVAKASAKHAAMLYQNAKDISDYTANAIKDMDHPGMAEGLQKIHDRHVPAMQAELKELLHKHHGNGEDDPDSFMEKVCKGMESDGAGATTETGEAQLVDQGQLPPDSVTDTDTNDQTDPDTEEINERYQDQESKKWFTRTIGTVRRGLNNRLYVVRKDFGANGFGKPGVTDPDKKLEKKSDTVKQLDDDDVEAVKDASDYMNDAGDDDQVPKGHRSAMKSHGKRLGQVHKSLTDMGKIQADGGRGKPLTDEGTAGNKGSMKDKGEPQTNHGTPSGKTSYEGGEEDIHQLKSWEQELIKSMNQLGDERRETNKVARWVGLVE